MESCAEMLQKPNKNITEGTQIQSSCLTVMYIALKH